MTIFRCSAWVAAATLLLTACPDALDEDGDGVPATEDCDDTDATVFPGNPEVCNGIDDDCDGQADNGLTFADWFPDADDDGWGDAEAEARPSCEEAVDGHVLDATDCDDAEPDVHPEAPELCNDRDDDCDGAIDNDVELLDWYPDIDGDGFGDAEADALSACDRPGDDFVAADNTDCDDTDAEIHPGAEEVPGDGIDQDCDTFDARTCFEDLDGDGYGSTTVVVNLGGDCAAPGYSATDDDCDDTEETVFPGAPEIPDDGIDQDCTAADTVTCFEDLDLDGFGSSTVVLQATGDCSAAGVSDTDDDCDDNDPMQFPGQVWYADTDIDTFGDALNTLAQCEEPVGYVLNDLDCDDNDPNQFPGQVWFEDLDGDTFGDAASSQVACVQPTGWVLDDTDCDDSDPDEFPGQVWFEDLDGDTFGNAAVSQAVCEQPAGWVLDATDCDDADIDAFPGAVWYEDVDGDSFGNAAVSAAQCLPPAGSWVADDTDCDDGDGDEYPGQTWYADLDTDTYGDPTTLAVACERPAPGAVTNGLDCDDTDIAVNPAGTEVCDGVDQNCDGVDDDGFADLDTDGVADCVDPDADGDGDPSTTDCDDLDAAACSNCGFVEVCGDGSDNDCDPSTSCWEGSYVDATGTTVPLGPLAPVPPTGGFVSWYDYNNTFGSSSNTGLEISDEVVMMTYVDPNNGKIGLVMIADIPNDGAGGSLTVQLSGMTGGVIAVMDDPGDNPLSALNSSTGTGTLTYNWIACCTDGFVITDLDPLFCATVEITASTGIAGITVYDGATAVPIPGAPGAGGALPAITFCETF